MFTRLFMTHVHWIISFFVRKVNTCGCDGTRSLRANVSMQIVIAGASTPTPPRTRKLRSKLHTEGSGPAASLASWKTCILARIVLKSVQIQPIFCPTLLNCANIIICLLKPQNSCFVASFTVPTQCPLSAHYSAHYSAHLVFVDFFGIPPLREGANGTDRAFSLSQKCRKCRKNQVGTVVGTAVGTVVGTEWAL